MILLYFVYRATVDRGYLRTLPERFGWLPRSFNQTGPGAIWLHAVSVGEVLASLDFLAQIRSQLPNARVFMSVSTLAGRATAINKLRGLADGVFYAPVDFVFVVRRVLRALQPSVVVIAETEIWPNLFRETKRTSAALVLVNGRISDRAFPRYRRFGWLFRAVLPSVDAILAQSDEMRDRFLAIGAPAERVRTAGNFKYDFEARGRRGGFAGHATDGAARAATYLDRRQHHAAQRGQCRTRRFSRTGRAASAVAAHPRPAQAATFDETAAKLAGIPHLRRSRLQDGDTLALPGVLLLDTIGELSGLFSLADVVFMGGTLVDTGGHNILEPALFGKPVITGPHMENFRAIAEGFRAAGASVEIAHAGELAPAVERLLDSPELSRVIGERARACAESQRGASAAAALAVRGFYESACLAIGIPCRRSFSDGLRSAPGSRAAEAAGGACANSMCA